MSKITITTAAGAVLAFRKPPNDATVGRLLRLFYACSERPDHAPTLIGFMEDLSRYLLTKHDPRLVAHIRAQLGPNHPNCRLSPRAHWLMVKICADPEDLPRVIRALTGTTPAPATMVRSA